LTGLLLVGAGGFGRAVADAVLASNRFMPIGFVDDRWPDLPAVWELPILGRLADLPHLRGRASAAVIAIGDNARRRAAFELAAQAGFELVNVIHPKAHVSYHVTLGRGVVVMAGAILGTEARLDDGAIVNVGAVVDHQARVGAFAHLGVGACMAGGATLGAEAWLQEGRILGPGAVVEPGRTVARMPI
jgi:sugar O-acyltransferase (sialic acid O-acetyltransferase NeuD family)